MKNKMIVILIGLMFLLTACTQTTTEHGEAMEGKVMSDTGMKEKKSDETMTETEQQTDWRDIQLKDVASGDTFKISDFKGKPIFIESFAVWCPTCRKQQDKMKELHEELRDSIVSISLDTDPNEDEAKVLAHLNKYNFDWRFAVSPVDLTKALIDEFGISVVNAPGAPIVLICKDQSARLLKRGVKSPEELKEEIGAC